MIEPSHIWWVWRNEKGTRLGSFDRDLQRRAISLIGAVATITFMQTLVLHMNSVMLMILQGPRSTAVYNIASPITNLLLSFLVFANVFLPLAVDMVRKKDYSRLRKYVWGFLGATIIMLPVIWGIMSYIGEFLITLLFKASYAHEAAKPLMLLMLGFTLFSFGSFITQILVAMQKMKTLLLIAGLTVLANIILNYVLIIAYDVVGAAAATVLSYLFFAALSLLFFCRHTSSKVKESMT